MSVLSDQSIRTHHGMIYPWFDEQLQPASYDLTLGSIGPYNVEDYEIKAKEFILASTLEAVRLPSHIVGRIEGKSSWARKGLIIHTAGFVDPGFHGELVLEITNLSDVDIILKKGMRIAQIAFQFLDKPAEKPYGHPDLGSHYQYQSGVRESWIK